MQRTSSIVIDSDNQRLKILTRSSKTDKFGKGETIYIYDNENS